MRFSFLSVQIAVWVGFALLTRFTWLNTRPPSWTWIFCYMGLGLAAAYAFRPLILFLTRRPIPVQMGGMLLGALTLGLLWRLLFNSLEYHVLESANNAFKFWGYFHNGKSSVVQLLAWGFGYQGFLLYHGRLESQKNAAEAQALAQEAKLRLLQYQIQPHFLFNTLSSLDTLLATQRTEQARALLGELVRFFRFAVDQAVRDVKNVPLAQELAWIQAYLAVEKRRFGDRLRLDWQVTGTASTPVPAGILMPLIENALKHGIHPAVNGGDLVVKAEEQDDAWVVTITNSLAPAGTTKTYAEKTGLGLKNTAERMAHAYPAQHLFVFRKDADTFEAQCHFPKEPEGSGV
ncbi:sensor histidine kinase [Acanthopleuribacter pedis]|uniref:Histidine kinase n=1 Tax=Acanthopleuribacter pedis TaxID=442870 RepID=A0A8J7U2E9_9BACT|nr:histidine kinase [Acanthopleuribacter pedis]MBO1319248.1 histidine kinase [Acanthopleuribacter pedis]